MPRKTIHQRETLPLTVQTERDSPSTTAKCSPHQTRNNKRADKTTVPLCEHKSSETKEAKLGSDPEGVTSALAGLDSGLAGPGRRSRGLLDGGSARCRLSRGRLGRWPGGSLHLSIVDLQHLGVRVVRLGSGLLAAILWRGCWRGRTSGRSGSGYERASRGGSGWCGSSANASTRAGGVFVVALSGDGVGERREEESSETHFEWLVWITVVFKRCGKPSEDAGE